ncbi:MAG: O-antigen ligase family protein [Saprospiraceae bacterium]|nr:O-antigen ligase family protein [Saprospiraceae bacterium]
MFCYIVSLAFQFGIILPIVGNKIQLPEIIFLLIFPLVALQLYRQKPSLGKLDVLLLLYLCSHFISAIWSGQVNSILEVIGKCYLILVYFCFREITRSIDEFLFYQLFKKSFLLLALFLIITGLGGWLLIKNGTVNPMVMEYVNYPYLGTVQRITGMTPDPCMFASLTICTIFILLAFLPLTFVQQAIIIACICATLLTLSKSNLLLLFGIILYVFYRKKWLHKRLAVCLYIIFFVIANFFTHFAVLKNTQPINTEIINPTATFSFSNKNIHETIYWGRKKTLWATFLANPLVGVGAGNSNQLNVVFAEKGLICSTFEPVCDPVSTYLGTLAEVGIIGGIILLLLIIEFIRIYARPNNLLKFCILLCFIVGSIEASFTDMLNFRHYWILLGVLVGLQLKVLKSPSVSTENFDMKRERN